MAALLVVLVLVLWMADRGWVAEEAVLGQLERVETEFPHGRFVAVRESMLPEGATRWLGRYRYLAERVAVLRMRNAVLAPADVAAIARLQHLRLLDLRGANVRDADLRVLGGIAGLKSLRLAGTGITEEGLPELARFTQLQVLDLGYLDVRQGWLEKLPALPELCELNLGEVSTIGIGPDEPWNRRDVQFRVAPLLKYRRLRELYFGGRLEDEEIRALARLPELRVLDLSWVRGTDETIRAVSEVRTLEEVALMVRMCSPDGLKILATLPRLSRLHLALPDQVDDAYLPAFGALRGVTRLCLASRPEKLSEGLLKAAMPQAEIEETAAYSRPPQWWYRSGW